MKDWFKKRMDKIREQARTNPGFTKLWIINIFLALIDIGTTLTLYSYIPLLEMNVLYHVTGSFFAIILLNVGMFWYFWRSYNKDNSSVGLRYYYCNVLVLLAAFRVIAIYSALKLHSSPILIQESVRQVQEIGRGATVTSTLIFQLIILVVPLIVSLLTFWVFSMDHDIKRKHGDGLVVKD